MNSSNPKKPSQIRPDFDTDVLWKPPKMSTRNRTISTDSTDSDVPPVSPTGRRFSLTGMLGLGGWARQGSISSEPSSDAPKKMSITETVDFKEFMRHQNRVLSDDHGFHKADYYKQKQ